MSARSHGNHYERSAEVLLCQAGLITLHRNWSCRFGEIDLIMREGNTHVFVEVRKRASARFGGAAASITSQKQQRIQSAIALYLSALTPTPACRIDAVLFSGNGASPQWLKNIF